MSDAIYYHYTTVAGGHGIVRSRRVWLTDYRFLNDKRELEQGYTHFVAALPEHLRASFKRAFLWHDQFNHHCVLSLSRSPKILSQWRAYADDATGLALGFSEKFLNFAKISLVPCQYESHESYALSLVQKHLPLVESSHQARQKYVGENEFIGWIHEKRQDFYSLVEDLIALKNPAFAEEQEVRAIRCVDHKEVLTRVSGQVVVPYVESNFWEDDEALSYISVVIPEIWLGPKCSELNMAGVRAINLGMCSINRYDCGYVSL
ncbi:MAG: DUF2971 domain-containing protein [Burkholderiales bacterium]|jgi:hypothetical protein|nr:DUF2971 domain-containing protein [Burkholderiales bacterium]